MIQRKGGWDIKNKKRIYPGSAGQGLIFFKKVKNPFNTHVHRFLTIIKTVFSPLLYMLTLQETQSIHESINITKIEFIAYICILL